MSEFSADRVCPMYAEVYADSELIHEYVRRGAAKELFAPLVIETAMIVSMSYPRPPRRE